MNFLHVESWMERGDVALVDPDGQANVLLMDDQDFAAYRRGDLYRYYGGLAKQTPARIVVPRSGHWNVVVNLGGYAGRVRAGVRFLDPLSNDAGSRADTLPYGFQKCIQDPRTAPEPRWPRPAGIISEKRMEL